MIVGWMNAAGSSATPTLPPGIVALDYDGDPSDKYVVGGAVTLRPAMQATLDVPTIAANGTDKATISGVPAGARARVEDVNGISVYVVTDGRLEITADVAGSISVAVQLWPYLDARYTVTAS